MRQRISIKYTSSHGPCSQECKATQVFGTGHPNHLHYLTLLPVLALSKNNTNAAEIILFLHRLTQVLIEYFKELEEESIRDNFVVIYELLDEVMDFGYPQTTESKILQEYVTLLVLYRDRGIEVPIHILIDE